MMIFSNPTYLWGLLGLLLPIAIHLWSRKKVITIKVGSTKLLQESEPKQTSSIKLNEYLLLALRLLSILVLVFILAGPNIKKEQENEAIIYLVEPSLINNEHLSSVLDTIPKESIRMLEEGFPLSEDYTFVESTGPTPYWQLAQDMHDIPADSLVVFSKGLLKGIQGMRPTLSAKTTWITIEPEGQIERGIAAFQNDANIELLSLVTNAEVLGFSTDTLSLESELITYNSKKDSIRLNSDSGKNWLPLRKTSPIHVGIVDNDTLKGQKEYFQAAYRAISKYLERPIEITVLESLDGQQVSDFNTLVLLRDISIEKTQQKTITHQPNAFATELIEKAPQKDSYHLTGLLNSENIVSQHLAEKLLSILELHEGLKETISDNDLRILSQEELQPLTSQKETTKNNAALLPITPWLWLLFVPLLIVERILSKLRKQ